MSQSYKKSKNKSKKAKLQRLSSKIPGKDSGKTHQMKLLKMLPRNHKNGSLQKFIGISIRLGLEEGGDSSKIHGVISEHSMEKPSDPPDKSNPEPLAGDFEFRLEDPVTMLPADELFSDGKLVPLQLSAVKPSSTNKSTLHEARSPEAAKAEHVADISSTDPYLFSPKALRITPGSNMYIHVVNMKNLSQ
ncbi:hypothetical protein K1719_032926 [Acacia pycnantha]|nr:hypothetical protein K1719_032926 [Acacia pycnantha]